MHVALRRGVLQRHGGFRSAKQDWFKTFLAQRNGIPSHDRWGAPLSAAAAKLAVLETVEKDHGRIEMRRYYQSAEPGWFAGRAQWEGLRSVGMVEAIREMGGQATVERRYYLASLPVGVETLARAVRGHWGVENKLRSVLDVQMKEDQSRARAGYAAENLATLRRLALNLLKRQRTK